MVPIYSPEVSQEILSTLIESENIKTMLPGLIDSFEIEIAEGRLPEIATDEIAIDDNVAKNNKL